MSVVSVVKRVRARVRLPQHLALRAGRRLPPNVRRMINAARGIDVPVMADRLPGSSVAVLAPHPDDELLGCGGTIAKHVAAGDRVTVLFVTSGERTASFVGADAAAGRAQREAEAAAACSSVGLDAAALRFLRLPEGGLLSGSGSGSGDAGRVALAAEIAALGPDVVCCPNPVDAHRDHRATAVLLRSALVDLPSVRSVALYEVWTPVYPTHVVDVGASLDAKLDGLRCYASALASVDYVRTISGLAAYRSGQGLHGAGFAEAFCVLPVADFASLVDGLALP